MTYLHQVYDLKCSADAPGPGRSDSPQEGRYWCTHTKNIGRLYPYHEHSKAPIPRTLESTENHIITVKTTSQRATAEKWLDKVHRSQALDRRRFFVSHQFVWQKVFTSWWCEDNSQLPLILTQTTIGPQFPH